MNSKIRVDFTLFGHGIDLERLTRDIGIQPAFVRREGDILSPTTLRAEFDVWRLSTGYIKSIDTLKVLETMLETVEPVRDKIDKVSESLGLIRELSVVLELRNGAPSFNLPAETIRRIGQLNCSVDVDILLLPEE